ncbi:MAG: hypothetical protein ACJASX_004605, partial [Limisphaerales bacterium]
MQDRQIIVDHEFSFRRPVTMPIKNPIALPNMTSDC